MVLSRGGGGLEVPQSLDTTVLWKALHILQSICCALTISCRQNFAGLVSREQFLLWKTHEVSTKVFTCVLPLTGNTLKRQIWCQKAFHSLVFISRRAFGGLKTSLAAHRLKETKSLNTNETGHHNVGKSSMQIQPIRCSCCRSPLS